MEKGFIMLSRKFFSNKIWQAARTFSECEAWLDLIQSARFEATDKIECIGDREITYGRGQYPASIRFLSKKWSWSERAVRTFLSKLTKEKMITTDNSQGMNVITLCKYDEYNTSGTANDTANDTDIRQEIKRLNELVTQLTTQQVTQGRHTGDTNSKKDNNNIYKEISTSVEKKKADESASLNAQKKYFDKSLSSCKESLLNDELWSDAVCMNNQLTKEDFVFMLNEFFKWLETSGETEKSEYDAKKHFASWLIIQKEKTRNGTARKSDATIGSDGSKWGSEQNISRAVAVGYALANAAGNK